MDIKEILEKCDHTLLKPESTWEQIKKIVDEGIAYHTASVCIPSCFVKKASEYAGGRVKICTVIGFPNGYETTETKVFQAREAAENGADEIDMVINIGALKEGRSEYVLGEIKAVRAAVPGKILKVIIETCLLTEEEKILMCRIVSESGADYIKTSTGFSKSGATVEDVRLLRKYSSPELKVKAAGGISSLRDAEDMILAGADRLGTSRIVKLACEQGK